MEEGLFKKYTTQIQKRGKAKEDIINIIVKETGILLKNEEVEVVKKEIYITTSSVKKQKLLQRNITSILQKNGFILKQ